LDGSASRSHRECASKNVFSLSQVRPVAFVPKHRVPPAGFRQPHSVGKGPGLGFRVNRPGEENVTVTCFVLKSEMPKLDDMVPIRDEHPSFPISNNISSWGCGSASVFSGIRSIAPYTAFRVTPQHVKGLLRVARSAKHRHSFDLSEFGPRLKPEVVDVDYRVLLARAVRNRQPVPTVSNLTPSPLTQVGRGIFK